MSHETTGLADAVNVERRVLVVDDEPDIVEQITLYLGRHGFRCVHAFNGADALSMAEADPSIAIVVTDVRMPGMDGLDLAADLRRKVDAKRHLQVIIMTGYAGLDHAIRAVHLGARDFLTKPVSLKQLLETVKGADEAVCARRRDEQDNLLLRSEVARREEQVQRLTERLRGLEATASADAGSAAPYLRDVLLPGLTDELSPAIETAQAMVELLQGEVKSELPEDAGQFLGHLAASVEEARRCLATVSDLTRALAGSLELADETVDLRLVLLDAAERAGQFAAAGGVTVESPGEHLGERAGPAVVADRAWLTRAFSHLLETAAHLSPFGGVVRMAVEERPEGARVRIDVGIGEEDADTGGLNIAATNLPMDRTGLGYALARRVLPMMGAHIVFEVSPGGTPSFIVTLSKAP